MAENVPNFCYSDTIQGQRYVYAPPNYEVQLFWQHASLVVNRTCQAILIHKNPTLANCVYEQQKVTHKATACREANLWNIISTRTVTWERDAIGFHGQANAGKTKMITHNAKCWLKCCKHCHWTGVIDHASISANLMAQSELRMPGEHYWKAGCQQ